MARSHSHITGAERPSPPPLGAGGGRRALALLAATTVPLVPIVLWMRTGDGGASRTSALVVATTLLCWALVRLVGRPRRQDVPAAPLAAPQPASAAVCRAATRRLIRTPAPLQRVRGGTPARAQRTHPPRPSRPSRDVRCRAATRRATRRRTRP